MARRSNRLFIGLFAFIISGFLVFDLFIHQGQPTTFDGPTHITNIAQIYHAMQDGEFPARWGGGFARYGLPIPIIAQQVTSYLGAFFTYFTGDVVLSYNLVIFVGALISSVLMYIFLRFYVSLVPALAGVYLFNFAPYRIMNIYIRGALPEFFASSCILAILISMYLAIQKEKIYGYLLLTLSVGMLLLTHPFMFVVGSFIFIPYGLFLIWGKKKKELIHVGILTIVSIGLAVGIAAYYLFPLFLEIKYFYYGLAISHFTPGHLLSISNFFTESWYYFYQNDVAPRGHVHLGGLIEGIALAVGIIYSVTDIFKKKKIELMHVISLSGIIIILFTLPISEVIYLKTPLSNIQHPWRMLSAYIFVAPVILALLIEKVDRKSIALLLTILIVSIVRFPQLYGKNYVQYPQISYFNTDYNLHGVVMDTVWMAEERTYPYQKEKVKIFEGNGQIQNLVVKNASRKYSLKADTDVKIIDYTFYYPGWKTYVDSKEIPIEFQDLKYRGVITYKVPAGQHEVQTIFQETKIRMLANIITLFSTGVLIALYFSKKKIQLKLYGK